jgi:hypothetical protein
MNKKAKASHLKKTLLRSTRAEENLAGSADGLGSPDWLRKFPSLPVTQFL